MSNKTFTQRNNVQMLWDVISDEEVFKFLNAESQNNIYKLFLNNSLNTL